MGGPAEASGGAGRGMVTMVGSWVQASRGGNRRKRKKGGTEGRSGSRGGGSHGESVNHCPADEWLGNPRCVAGSGLPEIEVTRVHRSEHDEACDVMDAGWAAGSWS